MTTTQITEVNAITGEIIEREFNAAERIAYNLLKEEAESMAAAQAAKAAMKEALLERLGITAEEAKLLLS